MTPLPEAFGLVLDRSVRTFRDGTVMIGGHPGRLITLTADGVTALAALVAGAPSTVGGRQLAGRLVDAGMAHPRPPSAAPPATAEGSITVVVPVHNRSVELAHCLDSLGTRIPVVVVDDASDEPEAVARVCAAHGARLIRRAVNGGPAAARNEALRAVETELVAFVDSDCTVTGRWLDRLVWLFDDPDLAAVAPRIRPGPPGPGRERRSIVRYTASHSALDMGPEPGRVADDGVVRYVPSAALVVRRSAVPEGFDPLLRVGEDVDLVWRLLEDGWRVRYEPAVTVFHREPSSWSELLARRFRYGTSAAPLARRHPGRLAPVEIRPWPSVAAAALLSGRPRLAAVVVAGSTVVLARQVRGHGIPPRLPARWSIGAAGWTVVGVGRSATMVAGPVLAVAARRKRWRTAVAALVLVPPLVDWWRRRPDLDPVRWSVASIVDDAAYGAGVWDGCLRSREFGPLIPAVRTTSGRRRGWRRERPGAVPGGRNGPVDGPVARSDPGDR